MRWGRADEGGEEEERGSEGDGGRRVGDGQLRGLPHHSSLLGGASDPRNPSSAAPGLQEPEAQPADPLRA